MCGMEFKRRSIRTVLAVTKSRSVAEAPPTSGPSKVVPLGQVRALKLTRQALKFIAIDASLAPLARTCALQLLQEIPDESRFARLVSHQTSLTAFQKPLIEARGLMQCLIRWEQGGPLTERMLEAALRCFSSPISDCDLAALHKVLVAKAQSSIRPNSSAPQVAS